MVCFRQNTYPVDQALPGRKTDSYITVFHAGTLLQNQDKTCALIKDFTVVTAI
jgi:hypothetical protein